MRVMIHDDDCGEPLDREGQCPTCLFHPDMQSTAFQEMPDDKVAEMLNAGRTLLGPGRQPITKKSKTMPKQASGKVKASLRYLNGTAQDRRVLALSMVNPAQELLTKDMSIRAHRRQARRILRWGERILGRAQIEGNPITEVTLGFSFDSIDFPDLLRRLHKHVQNRNNRLAKALRVVYRGLGQKEKLLPFKYHEDMTPEGTPALMIRVTLRTGVALTVGQKLQVEETLRTELRPVCNAPIYVRWQARKKRHAPTE